MAKQLKPKPTDLKLITIRSETLRADSTVGELRQLSVNTLTDYVAIVDESDRPIGIIPKDTTPIVRPIMFVPNARVVERETKSKISFFKKKEEESELLVELPPELNKEEIEQEILLKDRMLSDPLIIEYGTEIDIVIDTVFSRQGVRFDEDIILVNPDRTYFGLMTSRSVSRILYGFLGTHMTELRIQKEEISFQHNQLIQGKHDLELTNQKLEIASDKAKAGERMKDTFLANMSHEIRTPMNGVFGMVDLLHDTELSSDQEHLLSTARGSAETLMRIINEILDYSKVESGKVSVENIHFKLTEIVESSVALYAESASDKEIELSLTFDDVPPWVIGDPHRYQQILNNLISNAIKFTDDGKVEVKISGVGMSTGTGILTEVTDTGIGIPSTKIKELFMPFTQVDESTARRFGGTGLGLSICSSLVELMNGTLECDSILGKGACFSYVLPFEHYTEEEANKRPDLVNENLLCSVERSDKRTDFGGMKVLLVEDNMVNQEVAKRLLHKLNCEVVTAENGRVALEYLSVDSFDCVFMDCQMPLMDGYVATQEIRAARAGYTTKDIFISVMTAHAMSGDREKCIQAGMDHYFSKPFGLHDFRRALVLATEKAGPTAERANDSAVLKK